MTPENPRFFTPRGVNRSIDSLPDVSAFPMPVPDPPHLRTVRLSIRTEPEDTWDPHGRRQYDSRSAPTRVQVARYCRGTQQADRAPRGAIILMTGNTRGPPTSHRLG